MLVHSDIGASWILIFFWVLDYPKGFAMPTTWGRVRNPYHFLNSVSYRSPHAELREAIRIYITVLGLSSALWQ